MNLSATFCPRLSKQTYFCFYLGPDTLTLHYVGILVLEKSYLLFKLIFKGSRFQRLPEYDIFQNILFCTFMSSRKLGRHAAPVAAGQYLRKGF